MSVLHWPIARHDHDLPDAILTHNPTGVPPRFPIEAAIHLPLGANNGTVLTHVQTRSATVQQSAAGLLMSDYFLHQPRMIHILRAANISWVSNFPTVAQHGAAFDHNLSEVNMGGAREITTLRHLQRQGFRILACLSGTSRIKEWAALDADAVLIMPPLSYFANPDPAQLKMLENTITTALAYEGWQGIILPYDPRNTLSDRPCLKSPGRDRVA